MTTFPFDDHAHADVPVPDDAPDVWSRVLRVAFQRDDRAAMQEALLNGASLDDGPNDEPVLHSVIALQDMTLVRLVLDLGADPNVVSRSCQALTPLHRAVWLDHAPMVRLLLDRGADPSRVAFDGESAASTCLRSSPMHLAAERAGPAVMQSLIDADPVGVLALDGWGRTPLHLAMLHPDARTRDLNGRPHPTVALLLANGADPNAITDDRVRRSTPLHEAAYHGLAMVVQQLLNAGADPRVTNGMGETPLDLSRRRGSMGLGPVMVLERVELHASTSGDVDAQDGGSRRRL